MTRFSSTALPFAAILFVTVVGALAWANPSQAGVAGRVENDDPACEIKTANPAAKAEWTRESKTLPALVATGRFEIRGAYRLTLCGIGLSVYVLQDIRDRRNVYECVSDDTYRAAFPCAQLNSRP